MGFTVGFAVGLGVTTAVACGCTVGETVASGVVVGIKVVTEGSFVGVVDEIGPISSGFSVCSGVKVGMGVGLQFVG